MLCRHLLFVVVIALLGCTPKEQVQRDDIIGDYINVKGADDYTHLEIRDDNTYQFDQSRNYGDVWIYSYGIWELEQGWLKLYEGVNLEPSIMIEENEGIDADTLTIYFEQTFLSEFPELRLRIGLDSVDTTIKNGKLVLYKESYCTRNDIFRRSLNSKESTYQYYPLELNIRANQYFCKLNYILSKEQITIGLGKFKRSNQSLNELVKYKRSDSILLSVSSQDWIIPHTVSRKN